MKTKLVTVLMLYSILQSCHQDDPVISTEKTITSFSFTAADNPALPNDVHGSITGMNIHCELPADISSHGLKPTIEHTGVAIDPPSGEPNDFSDAVSYTVTAQDGSSQTYTITVNVPVSPSEPSVYVAGGQRFFGTNRARVWKDGIGMDFSNGTYNAGATALFVNDNSIYACGYESLGHSYAQYWQLKGEVPQPTPSLNETVNDANANSIYVAGTDVYVAGNENHGASEGFRAKVWKNGTATHLSHTSGNAYSVFVSGSDVYVAGFETTTAGWAAMLWKNGSGTILSPTAETAHARAVFVKAGNVYVAGQQWNETASVIKIWINGSEQTINPDTMGSEVWSIYVSDDAIYLAGQEIHENVWKATLWKNGEATLLSSVSGSSAQSVYVHNGDVYVAGWEYDSEGKQLATLWKNGVATTLATDGYAYSVMVK